MIIVTANEAARIREGVQTRVTRRGACLWSLGGVHPLQVGSAGPVDGWVRVVSITEIRLGSIGEAEAKEEGFPSLLLMQRAWRQRWGRWSRDLPVWTLRVVQVGAPDTYLQQSLFPLLEVQE